MSTLASVSSWVLPSFSRSMDWLTVGAAAASIGGAAGVTTGVTADTTVGTGLDATMWRKAARTEERSANIGVIMFRFGEGGYYSGHLNPAMGL